MKQKRKAVFETILQRDRISFAEFMELALYHPEWGYYTTKEKILGKTGDFYTSAHVGSIIGEVLGETYVKDIFPLGQHQIIEFGAGEGLIAKSLLDYILNNYPEVYTKIDFNIIEISQTLQKKQLDMLKFHLPKIKWLMEIKEIAPIKGMVYSNEFLDALPVHILKYFKEGIKELFVAVNEERLCKSYENLSPQALEYKNFIPVLPVGAVTEFCPTAFKWLENIKRYSTNCTIYAIDYGYTAQQKNTPQRLKQNTVRCFKNHKVYSNPLADVGNRDITADVDFTTLRHFAESIGFKQEYLLTQTKFILQSGIIEKLSAGKTDFEANDNTKLMNLKQLLFPGAMGEVFNVIKLKNM